MIRRLPFLVVVCAALGCSRADVVDGDVYYRTVAGTTVPVAGSPVFVIKKATADSVVHFICERNRDLVNRLVEGWVIAPIKARTAIANARLAALTGKRDSVPRYFALADSFSRSIDPLRKSFDSIYDVNRSELPEALRRSSLAFAETDIHGHYRFPVRGIQGDSFVVIATAQLDTPEVALWALSIRRPIPEHVELGKPDVQRHEYCGK